MARELLIVVGAGASKEVGLPVGDELKTQIASLLNFRMNNGSGRLVFGDEAIHHALQIEAQSEGKDRNLLAQAARHIWQAIPQAISIDNFIDTHAGNAEIELVGKLAIVRSILKAERNSSLYFDRSNVANTINFANKEEVWLTGFFRLLTENCKVDALPERMKSVTMIVFNYDRCIEHFLFHALSNYYRLSEDHAAELMAHMRIYHPYGKVGALPWQNNREGITFGGDHTPQNLLSLAKEIKTFTEGTNPKESEIVAIRKKVNETSIALFLGFAFHPLNLKLLSPKIPFSEDAKKYFATAYKMSDSDVGLIKGDLEKLSGTINLNVEVRNDLMCHRLFHEFGRSISLVR